MQSTSADVDDSTDAFAVHQSSDHAFTVAESATTRDDTVTLTHADRITFGVKSIGDLLKDPGCTETPPSFGGITLARHVWLPLQHEALALFEEYIRTTGTVYHILHFPTTKRLIETIYRRLEARQQPTVSHLALLLGIVSTGAYFWNAEVCSVPLLFPSSDQAEGASLMWRKWGLDVLENNRRSVYGSIEELQGSILLTHLMVNVEGFSARVRFLFATAVNMARDLSLHTTDSPRCRRDLSLIHI